MEKREYYPIFDQQVAGMLMTMRYRLVTARPDKNDVTKNIFFFDKTENLIKESIRLRNYKIEVENYINNIK